jgi:hypothetical protein
MPRVLLIASIAITAVAAGLLTWLICTSAVRAKAMVEARELDSTTREVVAAKQQLAALQAEATYQKSEVAFEKCEAERAGLQLEAVALQGQCFVALTEAARCEARNEATKARNHAITKLLGTTLVPYTEGTSLWLAPIAEAIADRRIGTCEQPGCDPKPETVRAEVLQRHRLKHPPTCERPRPYDQPGQLVVRQ